MTSVHTLVTKGLNILLVVGSLSVAACSDMPTSPEQSIDRVAAARVAPAVTDARVRIASGIQNTSLRERLVHDLGELESALTNGDGRKARFHLRLTGSLLADYRTQQGLSARDGADASAITLALHAVSNAIDGGYMLGR